MSMTEEEKLLLVLTEHLLSALKMSDQAEPCRASPPEPDVCLNMKDGSIVGVEFTSLNLEQDDLSHRKKPVFDNLGRVAAKMHESRGLNLRDVTLRWNNAASPPTKLQLDSIANQISQFIERVIISGKETTQYQPVDDDPVFIRENLSSISVRAVEEGRTKVFWQAAYGATSPFIPLHHLQSTLDRKKSKPLKYKKRYYQVWIVIHSGWESIYTQRDVSIKIKQWHFQTQFDRAFFLPKTDPLVELQIDRGSRSIGPGRLAP